MHTTIISATLIISCVGIVACSGGGQLQQKGKKADAKQAPVIMEPSAQQGIGRPEPLPPGPLPPWPPPPELPSPEPPPAPTKDTLSIGETSKKRVLRYKPWAGAPPECSDPVLVIEFLAKEIRESDPACSAEVEEESYGGATHVELIMKCDYSTGPRCHDVYKATFWGKRDAHAENGQYKIYGQSRIMKSCPSAEGQESREYNATPGVSRQFRTSSGSIEKLLDRHCGTEARKNAATNDEPLSPSASGEF